MRISYIMEFSVRGADKYGKLGRGTAAASGRKELRGSGFVRKPAKALRYGILFAAFAIFAVAGTAAFTFTPMTTTIAPSGANAVMTFKVTNDSNAQTAVAIKVTTREMDLVGAETNAPADKLFLVFPARVVLPPGSSQNVKVQYRGTAAVTTELAFRVMAEQLPVEFAKSTASGVSILLRYVAALYVAPANVTAKLVFKSAKFAEKDGKKGLEVIVGNEGTRHALITEPVLTLKDNAASSPVEYSGAVLSELNGQNILAKSLRSFFMPLETASAGSTYEGSIKATIE